MRITRRAFQYKAHIMYVDDTHGIHRDEEQCKATGESMNDGVRVFYDDKKCRHN